MGHTRVTARAAREMAARLIQAVGEPLVVLDAQLRIVAANRSFEQLLATTAKTVEGRSLPELVEQRLALPGLERLLGQVVATSASLDEHEVEANADHLEHRSLWLSARVISSPGEHEPTLLLALADAAMRQLAEHRRGAEGGTTGLPGDERARELESTARALLEERSAHRRTAAMLRHADRLAAVGRLAASLVHELGTPLNVVGARAKMIERAAAGHDECMRNAQIIGQQAGRMTHLLRRLLDFSRKQQAERHASDLGALTRATVEVVEPMARKQGVTLQMAAYVEEIDVEADATEVQQVVTNLLVNAIDAQPQGGTVQVAVGMKEAVRPADGSTVRCAVITVSDSGPGIAPDQVERVFEPFFTTKPVGKGTGLGLSVCQSIVAAANGWIDVTASPEGGAAFAVHLPLATAK